MRRARWPAARTWPAPPSPGAPGARRCGSCGNGRAAGSSRRRCGAGSSSPCWKRAPGCTPSTRSGGTTCSGACAPRARAWSPDMAFVLDPATITHGIQLAVAPVFLLTAVSGMIGAVAGRLGRIIDRARLVEDRALVATDPEWLARAGLELQQLRRRGRLANGCIALLTTCAFLIGLTI